MIVTISRVSKIASTKKYSGWDFNGDGRFPHDRVKGKDKKNRTRFRRTLEKEMLKKEIDMYC